VTFGLFPLWKVTYYAPGERIPWIYIMAPAKGIWRDGAEIAGVRSAANVRLRLRRTILDIEKVAEHPIMRGDEWLDSYGHICHVREVA
jgi:hypothetical protein